VQDSYAISDISPTKVIPEQSYWDSVLIINDGTQYAFLGNDSTVNVTSGFPLGPGSNKVWDGKQALYAVCVAGLPTTIRIIDNSGAMFDVTNVAGQILAQGLAGQIANAINVVGVPPIDRPEVVYQDTIALAAAGAFTSAVIDSAAFNSLTVHIDEVNGAAGSCATARQFYIWTYADAAGTIFMSGDTYSYMPSNGFVLITPNMLKGPYIQFVFPPLGAGAALATINITAVGSYRTTGSQARVEIGNSMAGAGFMVASGDNGSWIAEGNWPAGVSEEYPYIYSGPATFGWNVGALANQSYMYMYDVLSGGTLWALSFPVSAVAQRGSMNVYLPVHATRFRFNNSTAGAVACRFALTMDGNR
jgi:hypothetical protein